MMSPEEYVREVRRSMVGMEPAVREDILREVLSHIADAAGANPSNPQAAIADLGPPAELGRRYRELYGYGRSFKVLFAAVAFLLAIPSVPVLGITEAGFYPYGLSLVALAALVGWTLWVSVAAGSRVGFLAGLAGMIARFAAVGVVVVTQPGAAPIDSGVALFVAASILLPILGWLPGTAKRTWSKPRADL